MSCVRGEFEFCYAVVRGWQDHSRLEMGMKALMKAMEKAVSTW